MTLILADFILTCNENFDIIKKGAVFFDKEIKAIGSQEEFLDTYKKATIIHTPPHTVLMPGLINPHVHLEFSANRSTLKYGDFIPWLQSVVAYREELLERAKGNVVKETIDAMIKSGTTTFGAISSFGLELEDCINTPARVVFFNEVLGSRPDTIDVLFGDFKHRLRVSQESANARFIPAISVHAPYSTHPILARNTLDIARKEKLLVSTHFMESKAERAWIDKGEGKFADFFLQFSQNASPMCNSLEYLDLFYGTSPLFTHAVQATDKERELISQLGGTITHCPRSNRLLGTGLFDLKKTLESEINFTLGTDGYSSNNSLSLWDEMRTALMSHQNINLEELSKILIQGVTTNSAKALKIQSGELEIGKNADIIAITLPESPKEISQLPLALILYAKETIYTFIEGEIVK